MAWDGQDRFRVRVWDRVRFRHTVSGFCLLLETGLGLWLEAVSRVREETGLGLVIGTG